MLSWISSVIVNFVNGNQFSVDKKKTDCEKILCINSRGIHLVQLSHGCDKVLYLRNKLLGNHKIKYMRRKIFGSKLHTVGQILRTSGTDGESFLSTLR